MKGDLFWITSKNCSESWSWADFVQISEHEQNLLTIVNMSRIYYEIAYSKPWTGCVQNPGQFNSISLKILFWILSRICFELWAGCAQHPEQVVLEILSSIGSAIVASKSWIRFTLKYEQNLFQILSRLCSESWASCAPNYKQYWLRKAVSVCS